MNPLSPPIRVLHVIWSIDPSKGTGPAAALRSLALEQARAGLRVTIVTADAIGSVDEVVGPLRELGVVVRPSGPCVGPLQKGQYTQEVLRKVLADGIDVVHIHGMWQHIPHCAAAEARRAHVPYIMRPAGMLEPWALQKSRIKKQAHMALTSGRDLRHAAALQATSYSEARNLIRLVPNVPVAVVSHGVEFEHRPSVRRDAEAEAKWPELKGTRRALFLGRIDPVKGTMPLAEAWGRVSRDHPDWRLVIAGPDWGDHRAEFEESLSTRGVLDTTIFVGSVRGNDKRLLLGSCDVFVQPSFQENFGITIAEALAAGRPVITTKATPWQVLSVRGAGWWIEIGADPLERALRDAMSRSRESLDEMGSKGPWIIEERSSWPRIGRRLSAVYEWVLGKAKRPEYVYTTQDPMPEGWGLGGLQRGLEPAPRALGPALPRIELPFCSPRTSDRIVRYGLTLLLVALAAAIRWAIDHWVGDRLSLFMAYTAVASATFLLGVRPGIVALVLGYFVNAYLFMNPRGRMVPDDLADVFAIALYVFSGVGTLMLASWIQGRERVMREREWAAEAKISAQASELARSNAELERFADAVAKDLKEPLRALTVASRLLITEHGDQLDEEARKIAGAMERQSRRGMALVDSLLELSQAGRSLRLEDVDLSVVLEEVLEDLSPVIEEIGGEIVRQRLPMARCDRVQVSRILRVLIINGLLYNDSMSKRVEVGAGAAGDRQAPSIFVRDNGVGIAPEDKERVFELFAKLGVDGDVGGTGLALVKRLVQSHGGVVWLESRPGTGSTFYFTLQGAESSN